HGRHGRAPPRYQVDARPAVSAVDHGRCARSSSARRGHAPARRATRAIRVNPTPDQTPAPLDAIQARLMQLHDRKIDLTLDRMKRLLSLLDHPEQRMGPVIHVAGTNGKGSTVA